MRRLADVLVLAATAVRPLGAADASHARERPQGELPLVKDSAAQVTSTPSATRTSLRRSREHVVLSSEHRVTPTSAPVYLELVVTGDRIGEFLKNNGPVEVVRGSPNGTIFAVAGWDGVVNLWGTTTGSRLRVLPGPGGGILSLAFTPDSHRVVAGTELGQLQVWDVASGSVLNTSAAHDGNVRDRVLAGREIDGDRRPRSDDPDLGFALNSSLGVHGVRVRDCWGGGVRVDAFLGVTPPGCMMSPASRAIGMVVVTSFQSWGLRRQAV